MSDLTDRLRTAISDGAPNRDLLETALAEVERLTRWKAEATEVIGRWDLVYEALSQPGRIGERRADASREEVCRLLDMIDQYEVDWRRCADQANTFKAERDAAVAEARAAWAALNSIRSAVLADVGYERLCERVLDESAAALNAQDQTPGPAGTEGGGGDA